MLYTVHAMRFSSAAGGQAPAASATGTSDGDATEEGKASTNEVQHWLQRLCQHYRMPRVCLRCVCHTVKCARGSGVPCGQGMDTVRHLAPGSHSQVRAHALALATVLHVVRVTPVVRV